MSATDTNNVLTATASTSSNLAVIKYWGKRCVKMNLPINSSVSVTLNQSDLETITTVATCEKFDKDRLWLNGEEVEPNGRFRTVLSEIRKKGGEKIGKDWKIHVVSKNSFPTAAGLASSAAGMAALTYSLAILFELDLNDPDLTRICRLGSGSASRSLYSGFVKWEMGTLEDGTDSIAKQLFPKSHWDLHALICVVSDQKKMVGSTEGMIRTMETSDFLKRRAEKVPETVKNMELAIEKKDFKAFAYHTMRESNSFHSTTVDSFPAFTYLNATSWQLIKFCDKVNGYDKCSTTEETQNVKPICCYTFDAGPNAVLFMEKESVPIVLDQLLQEFGPTEADIMSQDPANEKSLFVRGQTTMTAKQAVEKIPLVKNPSPNRGVIQYIIHTNVGPGAKNISDTTCLVDRSTGFPLP